MATNRSRRERPPTLRERPHVVLLVETSLASGRDILRGIAQYVREHGPWSIYHEPRSLEDSVPRWLKRWRGDGIIARLQNRQIAAAVLATGVPAVDVLGVCPDSRVPLVRVNNDGVARLAAEHLLERGFRHFGFCGSAGVNWSEQRREAFERVLTEAGCDVQVYLMPSHGRGRDGWEKQEEQLARWIGGLPRPAGIMVANDPLGQPVLEACRRAGASVPDEIAVIGVDNDEPLCEMSNPQLSSIMPDHRRVGYEAAALLDRMIHGQRQPAEQVCVQPLGVVTRQSTEVFAIEDLEVARAVHFIRKHACDGIGVEDVAAGVALSRSVLKRRFNKWLGRPVHDEIVQVRIRRAQELLGMTDLPIATIAEKAGFRHQEYLGAVFKARVGQTPAQFRRQARGGG